MVLISPGAPSETISCGQGSPRLVRSRASAVQPSSDSRIPSITAKSTRSPVWLIPQAHSTPSVAPEGRTGRWIASRNNATSSMPDRSRAMNAAKRSLSSLQIRDAVDFEICPSPASSHSDSVSRIDSPRTNAPITIAFERLGAQEPLAAREQLGHERLGGLADLRDLDADRPLGALHPSLAKPVALTRRRLRPALVACSPKPGIELVLDSTLDDQLRAQRREL